MNHTKEPWEVIAVDDMYEIHSKTAGHEVVWSIDSIVNAQRIVDCVNACAGITNEALRAGYIKHLVEWDKVNHDCIDRIDSKITPFDFKGKKILEDK